MESPETRRDAVVEELHGERVEDPYRWLEGDGDEVEAWTERQNEYVDSVLDDDVRESLEPKFEPLADVPSFGSVTARGGRAFQSVRDADQERPVLTLRGDGDRVVLADPNEWEGEASMDWFTPSPDGERDSHRDEVSRGNMSPGPHSIRATRATGIVMLEMSPEQYGRFRGLMDFLRTGGA